MPDPKKTCFLCLLTFVLNACGILKDESTTELDDHNYGQVFQESGPLAAPFGSMSWLKGTRYYFDTSNVTDQELQNDPHNISFFDNFAGRYQSLNGNLTDFTYALNEKNIINFSQKCWGGEGSYSIYHIDLTIDGLTKKIEIQHINGLCDTEFSGTATCFAISELKPQPDYCPHSSGVCIPQDDKRTNTMYFEKTSGGCDNVKDFLDNN